MPHCETYFDFWIAERVLENLRRGRPHLKNSQRRLEQLGKLSARFPAITMEMYVTGCSS